MKKSELINKTQKTLKGATKMKKTALTTLLILTVLFIFSTVSYASGHSNSGFHHAMAYLAEKEIRAKEQKAADNSEVHIFVNTSVAEDEIKGILNSSEETDSADKKDSGKK